MNTLELHLRIEQNNQVKDMYENHTAAYDGDAGLDLFFPEDLTIKGGETKLVDLQVAAQMLEMGSFLETRNRPSRPSIYRPVGYYLVPRSSISKTPLRMSNSVGIVDSGYTGHLKVSIDNIKNTDYKIKKGDKLFQIVHPSLKTFKLVLTERLQDTERSDKGFGSSNEKVKLEGKALSPLKEPVNGGSEEGILKTITGPTGTAERMSVKDMFK